jgi:hypothetical protein
MPPILHHTTTNGDTSSCSTSPNIKWNTGRALRTATAAPAHLVPRFTAGSTMVWQVRRPAAYAGSLGPLEELV